MRLENRVILCDQCNGKVFVDFTFTDNKSYELYCILCGSRNFVGRGDDLWKVINDYVKRSLVG